MMYYIIQTIAFQVFFLLIYDLFLKKETFFNWNRVYLLGTAVLSLMLPLVKIERFKEVVSQDYMVRLPEVIIGELNDNLNHPILSHSAGMGNQISILEIFFYLGVIITLGVFVFKIIKIIKLIFKNPKSYYGKLTIITLKETNTAFSFFNYIFLGELIEAKEKETILKHELTHATQKHTLDLLFFEVFRIVFWFNPLVYMYQNKIMTLHEFIADAQALKYQSKADYYQNLLSQIFETNTISFINPFFKQSLIKKRIIMLQKSKSKRVKLFKYALLIPLVLGMLVYTSSEAQEKNISEIKSTFSELDDKELKEKIYYEILEKDKKNASFSEILNSYKSHSDDYILSRESYYKDQMYMKYFAVYKRGIEEKGIAHGVINGTYDGYLKWKKTDGGKKDWEFSSFFQLRLVVNDLKNITVAENERYNKKKALFHKDNSYTSFVITDGESTEKFNRKSATNINGTKIFKEDMNLSSDNQGKSSEDNLNISFSIVDQVPIFPGCEDSTKDEQKKCFSNNITKHISQNFAVNIASKLGLVGAQRITAIFKINKEGDIVDVRSRAPHPELEKEAIRVINTVPKLTPGINNGEAVNVTYSLPILFQVKK